MRYDAIPVTTEARKARFMTKNPAAVKVTG